MKIGTVLVAAVLTFIGTGAAFPPSRVPTTGQPPVVTPASNLPPCGTPGPWDANKATPNAEAAPICQMHATASETGRPAPAANGYNFVSQETTYGGFQGTRATIQVTNPNVRHPAPSPNDEFVAHWVMVVDRQTWAPSTTWVQLGYAEVSWRDDARHVFEYDTSTNAWNWYDGFNLTDNATPTFRVYYYASYLGQACYHVEVWWSGAWWQLDNRCASLNPSLEHASEATEHHNTADSAQAAIPPTAHTGKQVLSPAYGWIPWTAGSVGSFAVGQDGIYHMIWSTQWTDSTSCSDPFCP